MFNASAEIEIFHLPIVLANQPVYRENHFLAVIILLIVFLCLLQKPQPIQRHEIHGLRHIESMRKPRMKSFRKRDDELSSFLMCFIHRNLN